MNTKIETKPFDIVEYLDSEEAISFYLAEILATGDSNDFLIALGDIARARGMTELAAKTGLGRESLYKTLSDGSKPRFDTIFKIIQALNLNFSVSLHQQT